MIKQGNLYIEVLFERVFGQRSLCMRYVQTAGLLVREKIPALHIHAGRDLLLPY